MQRVPPARFTTCTMELESVPIACREICTLSSTAPVLFVIVALEFGREIAPFVVDVEPQSFSSWRSLSSSL